MANKINELLISTFKDSVNLVEESSSLLVNVKSWLKIADFIKNDKKMNFDYLMSITSYDKEDGKTFGLAYNFYSTIQKEYIEIRIEVEEAIEVPSVAHIWRAADWHEREAFDLMGIKFKDHPDMKRILLPEDWDGHPLRKDYETPEYYNGMPVPKDKSYWE